MFNNNGKSRAQWTKVETDNGEYVRYKDKEQEKPKMETAPAYQEQPVTTEGFLATLRKVCNFMLGAAITVGILLVGVLGHIGWEWFYGQNEFSEMQATLAQHGHELEASRLAEVGKVCKNGAGTPLACQALYFKKENELAMMAGGLR